MTYVAYRGGMAYTQSQLEAIEKAIALGVTRVEYADSVTQYQKLSDLIALRDQMKAELGVETTATARGRAWFPTTSNGL